MKEDINRQLSVCGANQQDCLVSFSLCFLPPSKKGDLLQSAEKTGYLISSLSVRM